MTFSSAAVQSVLPYFWGLIRASNSFYGMIVYNRKAAVKRGGADTGHSDNEWTKQC